MLTQLDDDGQKFVVAYVRCSNNKIKAKYNSYEGECLVVVWVVSSFQCYFYSSLFALITDHQPVKFLMKLNRLIRKLAKWAFILQEYDFDIIHRPRKVNRDDVGLN